MRIPSRSADLFALAFCSALFLVYLFILLNKPWTLHSFSAHDDALYVGVARSLLQGEWLGVYNDRILAKPPGFSLFIAFCMMLGLPFNIAVAMFQTGATGFFAGAILRLTRSRMTAVAVFALTLLSPQYFMLGRVLRETIYPAQILIFLGLIVFWMTSRGTLRWMLPAGLMFGWIWITREDGIWLLPGLFLCCLLAPRPPLVLLKGSLAIISGAAAVVVALGLANQTEYGRWTTAEIKDPTFVGMISATQSVLDGGFLQGIAVPKAARERIYEISPAFATLRPVLESPSYFDFACKIAVDRCGEIGNGWWHWAVRYAAWQIGYHASPQQADDFYRQVRVDIDAACSDGRLTCGWRPIAALPTMTMNDVWRTPFYALRIARSALLLDPVAISSEISQGDQTGIADMFAFLNRPPAFGSLDFSAPFLKRAEVYASSLDARFAQLVLDLYRVAFLVLIVVLLCSVVRRLMAPTRPGFNATQRLLLILAVLAASRIALLSLVGVTSFETNNAVYIGPVYHIAAVMLVLSIFVVLRPAAEIKDIVY